MNFNRIALVALLLLLFFIPAATAQTPTPQESLKNDFPDLAFDGIRATSIKGLYEITTGTQVYYYSPEAQILVIGEMITSNRKNLTRERKLEIITQKVKEIPLEKALRIGNGKNQVIEFSDPDCSHCRRASGFFSERENVTRYVFFFPLSPQSEKKIRHILCSGDRPMAYKEAYAGKLDDTTFDVCKDEKVEELLKAHRKTADLLGIEGTPFFVVNGKVVAGADLQRIEKLLGENSKQ